MTTNHWILIIFAVSVAAIILAINVYALQQAAVVKGYAP